jgi:uncharacterized protein (DUF58 family)
MTRVGTSGSTSAGASSGSPVGPPWRPTPALFRTAATAALLAAVAVLFRRPDALVLGAPFAVVTAWSLWTRPRATPTVESSLGRSVLREGEGTTWHGALREAPEADVAVAVLGDATWVERRPASGAVAVACSAGAAPLDIAVRSTRWGLRSVEPARIVVATPWAAYRWTDETRRHPLTTLPLPSPFDADAPSRPSDGLVGQHRSTRTGEGNEFAAIRPFQPGDRMRRINWPRSQRSGALVVNSTWADLDVHLALLLDANDDFGTSDGIDGRASSLDLGVRAAGAIAEHFAVRGERVSLRVFGTPLPVVVPPATGRRQFRRIVERLAHLPTLDRSRASGRTPPRDPRIASGGQLTVMLSPLVATVALDHAVALGRAGLPVIVVDTLPPDVVVDDDPHTAMAWRIRLLERRRELRAVRAAGIPVVTWQGPGSLDQVVRDIARRSSAPKLASR